MVDVIPFILLHNEELVCDVIIETVHNRDFETFVKLMQTVCTHYISDRLLIFTIYKKIFKDDLIDYFICIYGSDIKTFHYLTLFPYAVSSNAINCVKFMLSLAGDNNNQEIESNAVSGICNELYKNDWNDSIYVPISDIIFKNITIYDLINLIIGRANNIFKHLFTKFLANFNDANFYELAIATLKTDNIEILKYLHENKYYEIDERLVNYINNSSSRHVPLRVYSYAKNIVKFRTFLELIYCIEKRGIYLTAENVEKLVSFMI